MIVISSGPDNFFHAGSKIVDRLNTELAGNGIKAEEILSPQFLVDSSHSRSRDTLNNLRAASR